MAPFEILIFCCLSGSVFASALVLKRVMAPAPESVPQLKSFNLPEANSDARLSVQLDRWLATTIRKSGLTISPLTFSMMLICGSIMTGVASWFGQSIWLEKPTVTMTALSVFAAVMLGLIALRLAAKRREKQFSKHFPAAIELLARSVQAGESLEGSLEFAAESSEEPVASELLHCARQLQVGRSVASVMSDLSNRFSMMDVRIFAHTVSIHRETGGRLSETLIRLARVIRLRSEYLQKIRTMTGLGRFAAMAIGYMGVFVLAYLSFMHPEYIQKLWASPLGQKMAIYALISEFVGVVWVAVVLQSEN